MSYPVHLGMANTTMETFFQESTFNCFTCHESQPSGSFTQGFVNLDFVHSLIRVQQAGEETCSVDFSTCAQP